MPFTASHVMAVLPAMRRCRGLRLDPTCLAIGSMAPDFQYFLWARREGEFSHSLLGLVVFCLPLTLALATVWQRHVQWLMLELAPAAIARRCVPRAWPAVAVPMLVVSAMLGTATHLLWDGFTHTNDVFTSRIEELGALYTVPLLGTIPLHRVLQHVSTLVGLVVVGGAAAHAIARAAPREDDPSARRWRARLVVAGLAALAFAALMFRLWRRHWVEAGNVAVVAISATLLAILVASFVLHRRVDAIRRASAALDPV